MKFTRNIFWTVNSHVSSRSVDLVLREAFLNDEKYQIVIRCKIFSAWTDKKYVLKLKFDPIKSGKKLGD